MRKLFVLRGAPASGKSSFIEKNNLKEYTISSDSIRLLFESGTKNINGSDKISNSNDPIVWDTIRKMLKYRMERGNLTFLDATSCSFGDVNKYNKLSKKYNYEMVVVDFDVELSELIKRDNARESLKRVGESTINKFYERKKIELPSSIKVIKPEDVQYELVYKVQDFSNYEKVVFIGDLQGCYSSLNDYFKSNPFNDNYLYIFLGDYIDRGIENHLVIDFLISLSNKKNVYFLMGNHELHLIKYLSEGEAFSKVFMNKTLPQIKDILLSKKKEVSDFCEKMLDFLRFTYKGKEFTCTHSGLPFYVENSEILKLPSTQLLKGIGNYGTDIDSLWNESCEKNQYQVHGHRNSLELPIVNNQSINLEGKVEFGGSLRILEVDEKFKEIEIVQEIYDEKLNNKRKKKMSFLETLRANDLVKEKELKNGVSSFNFTKKAFFKKQWDETNIKARGLFIRTADEKIIARSYDKFFNLNERKETEMNSLKDNLKFPLDVYQKDNGFLGILGSNNGELFFSSKSSNETDFANWFKEIAEKTLNMEELQKIMKGGNLSMVFEVNDPINDPHIIEYEERHLVLLDVIRNEEFFNKLKYSDLKGIANKIGAKCKIKTCSLKNWEEFTSWYDSVNNEYNLLEGYVIEDSNSFMFKIKLPYYSFWKYMRTVRDRMRNEKEISSQSLQARGYKTFFYEWLLTQEKELLNKDIIYLRNKYIEEQKK